MSDDKSPPVPPAGASWIFEQLKEFTRLSPNWIPGDPGPAYLSLIERLRKRGTVGPLWGFFSVAQRFAPQIPVKPPVA